MHSLDGLYLPKAIDVVGRGALIDRSGPRGNQAAIGIERLILHHARAEDAGERTDRSVLDEHWRAVKLHESGGYP